MPGTLSQAAPDAACSTREACQKIKQLATRQRIRKGLPLSSLLLFPVTLYYFSPAHILGGAFLVFGLMFLSSLLVGRLWCGWACPAGALQEVAAPVNNKRFPRGKADWIKWAIWRPWIGLIAFLAIRAGGYRAVDPFYQIPGGATLAIPADSGGPP